MIERWLRLWTAALFHWFRWVLHWPKVVLLATAGVFVYFNLLIAQMPTFFTMEDTLDPLLPSVAATKAMERDFRAGISLYLTVHTDDGSSLDGETLLRLKHWLSSGVYNLDLKAPVLTVVSPFSVLGMTQSKTGVWFPPLLQPAGEPGDITPKNGVAQNSADLPGLLSGTPWAGQLAVAAGGGDVLAEVVFRDEDRLRHEHFPPDTTFAVDRSLRGLFIDKPHVQWHLSGPASFRAYSKQASDQDLVINAAIPVVLILLFRLFYGSWIGGLLIALAIVLMRTILLGTMAWCGYYTDPLSASLVTLVSLAAIEDFLFVTRYQMTTGASWRMCYQRFLVPSLLTSLTTMLGFASLGLSSISTVRNLGLWATYGALVQWVVIYFLIPCLQAVWPRSQVWTKSGTSRLTGWAEHLGSWSLPRPARRLVLPLLALSLLTVPFLHVEDSLDRFFPKAHPSSVASRYLQQTRGWNGALSVIVKPDVPQQQRQALVTALAASPVVGHVDGGVELIEHFTRGLEPARAALVRRMISVDDGFRSYFSTAAAERISVYIRESTLTQIETVMAIVQQTCPPPGCTSAGMLPTFVDFSHAVAESLFTSFATSLLIVALVIAGYLRLHRQRDYLAVLVSAVWGPVVMLAAMVLLRIPVNFVSCFFAAILVGLSGDNAIQYIYAAKRQPLREGIDARAGGSVEITICMVAIALLLLASAFNPPRTLGMVLAIGLVVNLAGDLWVLKLLLRPSRQPLPGQKTAPSATAGQLVPELPPRRS